MPPMHLVESHASRSDIQSQVDTLSKLEFQNDLEKHFMWQPPLTLSFNVCHMHSSISPQAA